MSTLQIKIVKSGKMFWETFGRFVRFCVCTFCQISARGVLADLSEKFSGQKNFLRGMLAGEFSHHKNIFFVCGEKIRPGIYVDDDFFIDAS